MSSPGEGTSDTGTRPERPDAPHNPVEVGNYVLAVSASGALVRRRGGPVQEGTDPLREALGQDRPPTGPAGGAAAAEVVEEASALTAKVERAVALGRSVAEGRALAPEQLALEVSTLLDLLARLDRNDRFEDALRLARALASLLMLLKRWAELLRVLRIALRAGEKLGDLNAVAWARHELGTLRLVAGDVEGAERSLREACEIRERIGDRRGLAATNRNLGVLCERLREMLREEELVRARGQAAGARPPRVAVAAVVLVLLFGGGVATGFVASSSGEGDGGATVGGGNGDGAPASGSPPGGGAVGQGPGPGEASGSAANPEPGPQPIPEPEPTSEPEPEPLREERQLPEEPPPPSPAPEPIVK